MSFKPFNKQWDQIVFHLPFCLFTLSMIYLVKLCDCVIAYLTALIKEKNLLRGSIHDCGTIRSIYLTKDDSQTRADIINAPKS